MALRFVDSFDHYANADVGLKWTSGSGFSINSSGRFGNCGYSGTNNTLSKTLDNQPTWIVGFAFRMSSVVSVSFFRFIDGSSSQCELQFNGSNQFFVTRNGTAVTMATQTAVTFPSNTWHYVEFMVTIGTSIAANSCQVHFDGQLVATVAAGQSLQTSANAYASTIQFTPTGSSNVNSSIDDFYACDGTGTANNTFLGDCRVEALFPDAAGDLSNWTPTGATPNFACVDQAAEDGDTTYVLTGTAGTYDSYKFGALSSPPAAVFGVQAIQFARKDDAGSHTLASSLRIAATSYDGAAAASLGNSYQFYPTIWSLNPNTGVAFTAADLASGTFQAGPKLVS